jgi:serine/threonine-protein kinase
LIPRAGEDDSEAPAAGPLSLDFLAPTDDPAMLGRVGVYEIAGVVGRGGAGIVLKAFERSLNRFVAIKVLAPHLATSAAARRRFAREAQAAAAVVHEHIVPIHSVDEHLGLPYMVMRYVPGRSLHERLERQGPLGLREILRIGMQTASGLAAAHAQGLVHRDIKPANILLENGVERVLLTDFGLARAVDDASLTCSGVIAGTPQYMAPEQARGEAVDHRTDLFSLGSVMYAMCTGHSPFRAESTMGVLHRICHETPRSLRELNPDMPEWFERIVRKLHAKDPARRFQTAGEVAELLESRLAQLQRPGGAWRDPWWQRTADALADWGGRKRWAWAAAVVAVLALVSAVVPWAALITGPPSEKDNQPSAAAAGAIDAGAVPPSSRPEPTPADPALTWEQLDAEAEVEQLGQQSARLEAELRATPAERPDHWWSAAKLLGDQLQRLEAKERDNDAFPETRVSPNKE